MRHLKSGRQLGRNASHRKAMFRNMVVSLLNQENITTTDAKAKELRRYAEKLITLGKRGTLHARRRARVMVNDKEALDKLFSTLAERYKERPGGYTRIVKIGYRAGDNAPLSVIQLVQEEMKKAKKSKPKTKAAPKKEKVVEEKTEEKVEAAEAETAIAAPEETASAEAEAVEAETPAEEIAEEVVEEEAKTEEAETEPAAEAKAEEEAEKKEEEKKEE